MKNNRKLMGPAALALCGALTLPSAAMAEPVTAAALIAGAATAISSAGDIITGIKKISQEVAPSSDDYIPVIFTEHVNGAGNWKNVTEYNTICNDTSDEKFFGGACQYELPVYWGVPLTPYQGVHQPPMKKSVSAARVLGTQTALIMSEGAQFIGEKLIFIGGGEYGELKFTHPKTGAVIDFNDRMASYAVVEIKGDDYSPVARFLTDSTYHVVVSKGLSISEAEAAIVEKKK